MHRSYAKASSAAFGHQPGCQSALGQFQNVLRKNIPLDLIRSSVNRRRPRLNEQPGWVQLTVAVQFPELTPMLAGNFQHCLGNALVEFGLITHKSVIKTTFLLYHAAVSAIAGG